MKQPFYIVWNPRGTHPPRTRHPSKHLAQKEAERLALAHPGNNFFVMQSHVRVAATEKPLDIDYFDIDEIPF